MAAGWVQQGIQLPETFRDGFRAQAASRGHSSVKTLGTIAVGILLGMPEDVRTGMFIWTQSKIARSGNEIDPVEIYDTLIALLEASEDKTDESRIAVMLMRALREGANIPPTESKGGKPSQ